MGRWRMGWSKGGGETVESMRGVGAVVGIWKGSGGAVYMK